MQRICWLLKAKIARMARIHFTATKYTRNNEIWLMRTKEIQCKSKGRKSQEPSNHYKLGSPFPGLYHQEIWRDDEERHEVNIKQRLGKMLGMTKLFK